MKSKFFSISKADAIELLPIFLFCALANGMLIYSLSLFKEKITRIESAVIADFSEDAQNPLWRIYFFAVPDQHASKDAAIYLAE